jgi:hypothetical protein
MSAGDVVKKESILLTTNMVMKGVREVNDDWRFELKEMYGIRAFAQLWK